MSQAGFISVDSSPDDDILTITGDTGGALSPTAGNINIFGLGETSTSGTASTLSILSPRVSEFVVDPTTNNGTHTTVASALSAASSGDTIYIRPGTYIEDLTLKSGISFTALPSSAPGGFIIIKGKMDGSAGTSTFANIIFKTNADVIYDVTGTNTIQTQFNDCTFFMDDGDCITLNNANASPVFENCEFIQSGSNFGLYTINLCNQIKFSKCELTASGASVGTASIAGGTVSFRHCRLQPHKFTTSSSAIIMGEHSSFIANSQNLTPITTSGTGSSEFTLCEFQSGTSDSVSVGSGTTVTMAGCTVKSTNSTPLSGAGTLVFSAVEFIDSGNGIDVTTQTARGIETGKVQSTSLVADPASGDSYTQYNIAGTGEFRVGVDDNAGDAFKISQGAALGTNDTFVMTAAGERTLPLNPCFLAVPSGNLLNKTGDGAVYTIVFATERFDLGSNFDGTSTFTAPVTGKYQFNVGVHIGGVTAAGTFLNSTLITSNYSYQMGKMGGIAASVDGGQLLIHGSVICDMDALDTATLTIQTGGEASDVVDILTGTGTGTYFSGSLIA